MNEQSNPYPWRFWLLLLLGVMAVKAVVYGLDPLLQFFMGDSASYIYTSLTGWIPSDRSFTYGYFIRAITWRGEWLDGLVLLQVLLSGLSCMVLAWILVGYLDCSRRIAAWAALLCALEPIQLLMERYAMAETVSLFVFSLLLLSLMQYLRRGNAGLLFVATALGMAAASLRTAYLPPAVILTLLAIAVHVVFSVRGWWRLGTAVAHVLVVVVVFLNLQVHEDELRVQRNSPNETGLFLISAWAPLLADSDLRHEPPLAELSRDLDCELGDPEARSAQLWYPNCLAGRIRDHFDALAEASAYSQAVAVELALHDPLGVLELGVGTWLNFWNPDTLSWVLAHDRGTAALPADFIELMQTHYQRDVSGRNLTGTLSNWWFSHARWWHLWVISSPLFLLLWWLATLRSLGPYNLLVAAAGVVLLMVVTALVVNTSIRFFHPLGWLSLIGLASTVDRLLRLRARR